MKYVEIDWRRPEVRRTYPHLLRGEVPIWTRFLGLHGSYYEYVAYDVHVGTGIGPVIGLSAEYQKAADVLSKKRIDVLGRRKDELWLFEVKPYAGITAPGQILGYTWLWDKENPSRPITHWGLVTNQVDEDTKSVARAHDIRVFVV